MAKAKEEFSVLIEKLEACLDLNISDDPNVKKAVRKLKLRLEDVIIHDQSLAAIRYLFHDIKDIDIAERAKEIFRKIMCMKPVDSERDKRMPHKDQLEKLKKDDPGLCKILQDGTVRDFYDILYPNPEGDLQGTVFCLNGTKEDHTIFEDLTKRAKLLAKEIKDRIEKSYSHKPVKCYLMDGFGRVFLCLIKALIDEGVDPDDDVEFVFCEIDDDVHKYHKYVYPSKVTNLQQNVLKDYGDYVEANSVVYLNFCSIPSSTDQNTWKMNMSPRCVKENVLKFIQKLTDPPKRCSIMVSLVVKDVIDEGKEKFFPLNGNKRYITGLGFLKVIRDPYLFSSGDKDILLRPDGIIPWDDGDVKRKPSACGLNGKLVQVFATVMVHGRLELTNWLEDNNIRIDNETIQVDDMVKITTGEHNGKHALVIRRTQECADVVLYEGEGHPKKQKLSSLEKLDENAECSKMHAEIKTKINCSRRLIL